MSAKLPEKHQQTLDNFEVFVATTEENFKYFKPKSFGVEPHYVAVDKKESEEFLKLLHKLDGLSYGDEGLPMDKWVMLDCGLLPSAFVGFAKPAVGLDPHISEKMEIGSYDGLVPISMACGIKSVEPGTWVNHTLASIIKGGGVGTLTKAVALDMYGAKKQIGVAQYDNPSLKIHTRFGDLHIKSATTAMHSLPKMTFIYEVEVPKDILSALQPKEQSTPTFYLDPKDDAKKEEMQNAISGAGAQKYFIIYPGLTLDGTVPVKVEQLFDA